MGKGRAAVAGAFIALAIIFGIGLAIMVLSFLAAILNGPGESITHL